MWLLFVVVVVVVLVVGGGAVLLLRLLLVVLLLFVVVAVAVDVGVGVVGSIAVVVGCWLSLLCCCRRCRVSVPLVHAGGARQAVIDV